MDPIQTMPALEQMVKGTYTIKEMLNYHRNVWTKHVAASLVDVEADTVRKAINPTELVEEDEFKDNIEVAKRLELRKIRLESSLRILAASEALLALTDEELAKRYAPEALKIADDQMPEGEKKEEPKA